MNRTKTILFHVEDADAEPITKAKGKLTWKQFVLEMARAINERRVKNWPPKVKKAEKPDT